ncbi:MAG: methionyl-tRNA formyltransferase [Pseudanabaenaceae cyanobacterium bins.68]|nr:methionyl-tRNA formyltransferase [Pseudanabaenaceae cyanobacterium bins.68]
MKIVFFGTPTFAVPSLVLLSQTPGLDLVGIVTQPDTRRGRGNQFSYSPVKQAALEINPQIQIWQPDRLKKAPEVLAALRATQADLFIVVAYGQILSPEILGMPHQGCINLHGSLLPQYRGAAPIQWAIANGEQTTGVTTMQMDAGIDTGDMLLKAGLEILPQDQAESLSAKLADLGANLLIQTLNQLDQINPTPQDHSLSSYAPMITKIDLELDWSSSAKQLRDRIRGFYPDCFTNFRGQRLKISQAELIASQTDLTPGAIAALVKQRGFVVQTGAEQLLITEVQPAGKKIQTGWDFANGARIGVGESLTCPG